MVHLDSSVRLRLQHRSAHLHRLGSRANADFHLELAGQIAPWGNCFEAPMPNDLAPAIIRGALTISNFKPISAGAMVGFVDVHLPSGMTLHRCSVFAKDGRAWAAPPAKQITRDGAVQRTADGKARYEPCISFVDRATQERWSNAVIAALRLAHPEVLP
jgi:hypothetical protein